MSDLVPMPSVPVLPKRAPDAHKGHFGTVLVVAGSLGMSGAAALVGKAALRSGAGLVKIACPKSVLPIVAGLDPVYTTLPLPEDDRGRLSQDALGDLLETSETCQAVALGPGLGVSHDLQVVIEALIRVDGPTLVIDADGLNNLSKIGRWPDSVKATLVLTPHPGEMKRLWASVFRQTPPESRTDQAAALARTTGTVVLLKGAQTVVTDGHALYLNDTGNPGMATGGSGDVLTGIIGALIGQGLAPLDAAVLGAHIHGLAGDLGARTMSQTALTATDIIDSLPKTWLSHEKQSL